MLHGRVDGQQLSVIGAVFLLSWAKFPGEEGERLPGAVNPSLLGCQVTSPGLDSWRYVGGSNNEITIDAIR
jgi:hypothetical protein